MTYRRIFLMLCWLTAAINSFADDSQRDAILSQIIGAQISEDVINIQKMGAKGNGIADCLPAFRKAFKKATRKKNVKVIKNDDSIDGDNGIVDTPDVSDKVADNNVTVQYGDVVKNDENASDIDDNVTSSYNSVETSVEDVSFTTFMSIYEHQDKGGFDTEAIWNRLNDDEKREAIRYARSYVLQIPDTAKREWPSKFISTRPWAQIDNH